MKLKKLLTGLVLTTAFTLSIPIMNEYSSFDVGNEYVYAETEGDWEYTVTSGKVTITKYNGSDSEVKIPSNIGENDVTIIGGSAFEDNRTIISVEIPDTIVTIERYAFSGCTKLESVDVPDSVTQIDSYAFAECSNLVTIDLSNKLAEIPTGLLNKSKKVESVEIPANVKKINSWAFDGCTNLKTVTFEENSVLDTIFSNAFSDCTSLQEIELPSSLTSIAAYVFKNCTSIKNFYLPKNVTNISAAAFQGCDLESMVVDGDNSVYKSHDSEGYGINAIIIKETNEIAFGCKNTVIAEGITGISNYAFIDCKGIKSIEFPSTVTKIGSGAFLGCSGITNIEIPETVTEIKAMAFSECTGLTNVKIISENTVWGEGLFNLCSSLTTVILPNNLSSIPYASFMSCTSLKSIEIPDGVTSIDKFAFYECTALEKVIVSPNVTSIDNDAFKYAGNVVIYCEIGSYAYTYAKDNGIKFKSNIAEDMVVVEDTDYVYTGNEMQPSVQVSFGDIILVKDTDYTVEYSNNVNVGTASVTVTGIGNYEGIITNTFEIKVAEITGATLGTTEYVYDGSAKTPEVIVKSGDIVIPEGNNYDVVYSANVNVGTVTVTVTGKGNCTGTVTNTFEIKTAEITEVTLLTTEYVYDGKAKTPEVIVKSGDVVIPEGNNYDVTYSANVNAGTVTVTVTGKGNCTGTVTNTFEIKAAEIEDIILEETEYTYDGKEKVPTVEVKSGETVLVLGKDYEVTYSNNIKAGEATITVIGKGNYAGEIEEIFIINPVEIEEIILEETEYTYDGKVKKPSLTVKAGDKVLKEGTDYEVKYSNNVKPGKATVTIVGKGNYDGEIEEIFVITPAKVTSLKQKDSYSTSWVQLTWKKLLGVTGYEVYRATSKNGKYTLVKTLTGTSYKDTELSAGKNYYYKVRAYKIVNGEKVYGDYSTAQKAITKTKSVTIKTKKSGSSKVKVTWKKVTGAEGYEVYMKTGAKGKYVKVKTLSSGKVAYTTSKLNKGKKYYFKVRVYKKVENTKVYSAWSKVKSITIK